MCNQKTASFQLSDKTKEILLKFSTSRSLPLSLVLRAKTVLLASEGRNSLDIIEATGISYSAVHGWRNCFYKNIDFIERTEESLDPDGSGQELENVIKSALFDKLEPVKEPNFTQEQILLLNQLACKNPQDFGWKLKHWNLPSLAAEAARQGIVDSASPSGLERFLEPEAISNMQKPSLACPKQRI